MKFGTKVQNYFQFIILNSQFLCTFAAMICKRHLLFVLILLNCLLAMGENATERTKRDFQRLGLSFYECHDVRILPTGEIKFRDLFQTVEQARKYILMDYFKFQQDSICGALLDILRRKAREGVKVYILFDSFGNHDSDYPLSDTLQASIRRSGVEIAAFDPLRFPWINHLMHRDHHKIAVIDGEVVYTGGMNVADYYLHGKPKVGKWRDMHIRMSGSIVMAYEGLFWKSKEQGARSKRIQKNLRPLVKTLAPCPLPLAPVPLLLLPAGRERRPASCGRLTRQPSTTPSIWCRLSTPMP